MELKAGLELGERCRRGLFAALALVVPILVGYDIYFQSRVSTLDFTFDHTGLVHEVPAESYADWAGLWPGDLILTVDGLPFSEWIGYGPLTPSQDNYMMTVERAGRRLVIEIPNIPMAKANLPSLASAVIAALTFWGIGLLLLLRRYQQRAMQLLFPLSQAFAVMLIFPLAHPMPMVGPEWGLTLGSASFYVAAPLLLHYYLTFPVPLGAPPQRRHWLIGIYGVALMSLLFWMSGHPGLRVAGRVGILLETVAAVVVLLYVYAHRATPDSRRRLRLIVFGTVTAAAPCILFYILPLMADSPHHIPEWSVALFLVAAPLSYLYATVQHNLFGIDRLLNRTLVYALLSLGILLLYLGPFLLIYRLSPGDLLAQMMVAAGLTLLVGISFDWTRTQVQRLVDRVFYGGWYDYPGVVETVSDALARSLTRGQLAEVLTRQVPALMQLSQGRLWIGGPDNASPQPTFPSQLQFPLVCQGQVQGVWTVGPRRDGDLWTAADRRILRTLAQQAEIALSNVLLVETLRRQLDEIRDAQHRLLHSREEERARLARDLHDGPIQVLVGLNLQLGLLLTTTARPQPALDGMRAEVRRLLHDLRQVCGDLRPPMLDTLGLGAALRALADDWTAQHPATVRLDLPPDGALRALPGDVSVHLYRIAQEAMSNVARHAEAKCVTIRLTVDDARLALTIQDDGRGFDVPETLGPLTDEGHFGLMGMQERVELIGGTWTVESTPGQGTTIHATWQHGK